VLTLSTLLFCSNHQAIYKKKYRVPEVSARVMREPNFSVLFGFDEPEQ
jgi:hypothetical protein